MHPNRTEADREREVTMMTSPDQWPLWPWLPVKRSPEERPCFGRIYADHAGDDEFVIFPSVQQFAPPMEYADASAAFDDGWVVD